MKIEKIIKKPIMDRWHVTVHLNGKINWDMLTEKKDVEYNPDAGDKYPKIRTSAGTICFKRSSIQLMNPFEQDINPLIGFALSKMDGRYKSKSWLEFRLYWKKEIRELDKFEKKLIGKK